MRLKKFLSFEQQQVLVDSFILSNFDCCPLVWFISSVKSLKKVENLQKRALRFLQNDYRSFYETLLHKSGKTTVTVRNLRNLCNETFKSLNNLNLVFLKEVWEKYKSNLQIAKINQVEYKCLYAKSRYKPQFLTFSIYCLSCVVLIYYLFIFENIV